MLCRNFIKSQSRLLLSRPLKNNFTPSLFYSTKNSQKSPQQQKQQQTEHHHDENSYYLQRVKMLKEWEEKGKKSYENHKPTTHTIQQIRENYSHLNNGEKVEDQVVSVSGTFFFLNKFLYKFYNIHLAYFILYLTIIIYYLSIIIIK